MRERIDVTEVVCWRLTRECNRACRFCLSSSGPHFTSKVTSPRPIAARLAQLGFRKISYSGGEPLMVDFLPDLVDYADRLGLAQVVTTNGDLLSSSIPGWFATLEHVKLSFYGDRALHDALMGQGNFEYLVELAGRLRGHGISVSANFMLSSQSSSSVGEFLDSISGAGLFHVVLQTYISARRRRVDREFGLSDVEVVLDQVRDQVARAPQPPGGVRVHDFRSRDWLIVLDECGALTLPSNTTEPDHILGDVFAPELLPLGGAKAQPSHSVLEHIWGVHSRTPAVVRL